MTERWYYGLNVSPKFTWKLYPNTAVGKISGHYFTVPGTNWQKYCKSECFLKVAHSCLSPSLPVFWLGRYNKTGQAGFIITWRKPIVWKEMTSVENKPHQIGLWASLLDIFFVDDWCERAQITVGCATPGLVILNARRTQAEQGIEEQDGKQHLPTHALCFSACLQVPALRSWPDFL